MNFAHRQSTSIKTTLLATLIICCAILVLAFTSTYSSFLATRVAPGLPFKITRIGNESTPRLIINQETEIEWDTRPENIDQFPAEMISLCPANVVSLTPDCETLDFYTPNDGLASVYVPPTISPNEYNLVFTAWNSNNRINFAVNSAIRTNVVAATDNTETSSQEEPQQTNNSQDSANTTASPTPGSTPTPTATPTPTSSQSPTATPPPNTSVQLILLNEEPVATVEKYFNFAVSNVEPEEIECISMSVNGNRLNPEDYAFRDYPLCP